jgi:hypothetical protein
MDSAVYPKRPVDFGNLLQLRRVLDRYVIFTPAILYLWCGFTDEIFWNFSSKTGIEMKLSFRRFNKPIFRGLELAGGDPDWNHALWFVDKNDWLKLQPFLEGLVFSDEEQGYVARPGVQEVEIMDPLMVDKGVLLHPSDPTMSVFVLGWDGSNCLLGMDVDNKFPQLPIVKKYSPAEYMVDYAKAFFKEVED